MPTVVKLRRADSTGYTFARKNAHCYSDKAELPQVGIFFCTQFPSLGIFINKKVGNRKRLRQPSIQLLKRI